MRAARNGEEEAQRDLGYSYFYGQGILEDKIEAVHWYRKAAKAGDSKAQYNLGLCYAEDEGGFCPGSGKSDKKVTSGLMKTHTVTTRLARNMFLFSSPGLVALYCISPFFHAVMQPAFPSGPRPSLSSPIVPAYLGLWEAKEVFVPDANGHLRVDTTRADPELSSKRLLPHGQHLEFTDGYDAKSGESFLVLYLWPPFLANCLQYPCLEFNYTEHDGVRRILQEPIKHEYDLEISKGEAEVYEPVGAKASEVTYFVSSGLEWSCEYYVTRDRQRMWTYFALRTPIPGSDHDYTLKRGFQLYHRLAEHKRHPIKP